MKMEVEFIKVVIDYFSEHVDNTLLSAPKDQHNFCNWTIIIKMEILWIR